MISPLDRDVSKWRAQFDFINRTVTLDGQTVPMKPLNAFSDPTEPKGFVKG